MCGTYNLTRVISFSYEQSEPGLPPAYMKRQCNEFMYVTASRKTEKLLAYCLCTRKLSLQGHTLLFSSGDGGVGNQCPATIFKVLSPTNCPWITSVGETRLYPNQTVRDRESAMQADLEAYYVSIGWGDIPSAKYSSSGGG